MMRSMTSSGYLIDSSEMPIKTISTKRGFALGLDGEPLPLRITIEKMRQLQPSQIRRLLEENKSIEEIKAVIRKDDRPIFIYRGDMWLDDVRYKLVEIDVTRKVEGTLLEADVMEPQDGTPSFRDGKIVGHITTREGVRTIEGELAIDQGRYGGNYTVLLNE